MTELKMTEHHQACRIVLAARPKGRPTLSNFRLESVDVPTLGPGQILLRTLYLSLDPYMRGRMDDRKSYAKPVALGDVMGGESVAEVVSSDRPGYAPGDIVLAPTDGRLTAFRTAKGSANWIRRSRR